jgi:hypothetical protein
MKRIKTTNLGRKAVEHLISIGFTKQDEIDVILDSPFLFLVDYNIETCHSVYQFNEFDGVKMSQENILKLRPKNEKESIKKMSYNGKLAYKLLAFLNNRKITSYNVSWTIQDEEDRFSILPISEYACGSISKQHLDIGKQACLRAIDARHHPDDLHNINLFSMI